MFRNLIDRLLKRDGTGTRRKLSRSERRATFLDALQSRASAEVATWTTAFKNIVKQETRRRSTSFQSYLMPALQLESLEERVLLAYSATLIGTVVTLVGDMNPDSLTIDQGGGGLLRHNRMSGGDAGYISDNDFFWGNLTDDTILASAVTILTVTDAGNNDTVVLAQTPAATTSTLTLSSATLSVRGVTSITDDGDLTVSGLADFAAGTGFITLGSGAETTNFGSLTFNTVGAAAITEDDSTTVSGASTAGAGLTLVSADDVNLNNTVNVTGNTSVTAGTTTGGIDVNAKLTGSGTIHLDAADEITVDAAIDPTTVTLEADDDITINAAVSATNLITVSAGQDGSGSVVISGTGSLLADNVGNTADVTISTGVTTGNVTLTGTTTADDQVTVTSSAAGSINGAGLVTAATVDLNAATGIGNTTALELAATSISADTTSGNVDVDNTLATAVNVTSLITGGGSAQIDQSGGGDLTTGTVAATTSATVTNSAGAIALDGSVSAASLVVNASGSVTDGSDGDLAITANASITGATITLGNDAGNDTNFGSVTFNSAGAVAITEDDSTTVSGASTAGAGLTLVSADDVNLNGTVIVTGNTSVTAGTTTGGIDVNAKLTGSGTIHLDAADEITVDAAIDPTTVTIEADDDITINAPVTATALITVTAGLDGSGSATLDGTLPETG
ncbi:MAG TPA: hypothetical protein QF564_09580, partial [Pirellulaceae bacterium]|nr:hypothetical protein [Pirellulaceae bacterium]